MSFTAEVKDELSRVEAPSPVAELAQLSALVRICGTLSFHGSGRYSIRVATETGAVARTVIKLTHKLFDLETSLTVRRSVLHKTRNYLIEIPEQEELDRDLVRMGILAPDAGSPPACPQRSSQPRRRAPPTCAARSWRAASSPTPRGEFHLEIAVTGEDYASDLVTLVGALGASARLNRRRGAFAIYLKSYDDVSTLLRGMGALRTARFVDVARAKKSVKNDVNRRVNAEMANQARSTGAAVEQLELIERAERAPGLSALPPALREFCRVRRANPELSLAALGEMLDPPASKSAMYHRVLRLQAIVEEARATPRRTGGPDVLLAPHCGNNPTSAGQI